MVMAAAAAVMVMVMAMALAVVAMAVMVDSHLRLTRGDGGGDLLLHHRVIGCPPTLVMLQLHLPHAAAAAARSRRRRRRRRRSRPRAGQPGGGGCIRRRCRRCDAADVAKAVSAVVLLCHALEVDGVCKPIGLNQGRRAEGAKGVVGVSVEAGFLAGDGGGRQDRKYGGTVWKYSKVSRLHFSHSAGRPRWGQTRTKIRGSRSMRRRRGSTRCPSPPPRRPWWLPW